MLQAAFSTDSLSKKCFERPLHHKIWHQKRKDIFYKVLYHRSLSIEPTVLFTIMHLWAKHSAHALKSQNPNFYLQFAPLQNSPLLHLKSETHPTGRVPPPKKCYMKYDSVARFIAKLRDEIFKDEIFERTRLRLRHCRFGGYWISRPVVQHQKKMAFKILRLAHSVHKQAFDGFHVGIFFARVKLLFNHL